MKIQENQNEVWDKFGSAFIYLTGVWEIISGFSLPAKTCLMQYFALFVSFLRQNDDRLKFKHNYDINKDPKGYIKIKREITR